MIIELAADSAVPPFEQIREQIASAASTGTLPVGTRLPAIRQLATQLGLAAGTVARAYRELEADGVVAGRGRHGTVVLPRAGRDRGGSDRGGRTEAGFTEAGRTARLAAAAREFTSAAAELGATRQESVEAVRQALKDLPG